MQRRLPTYNPYRIAEAIRLTAEATGWTSRDLIADAAAEYLTCGCADDVAIEDARRQVMEFAALVEEGA